MQQGPQFVTAAAAEIAGRWMHSRGWNFYAGRTECLRIFHVYPGFDSRILLKNG